MSPARRHNVPADASNTACVPRGANTNRQGRMSRGRPAPGPFDPASPHRSQIASTSYELKHTVPIRCHAPAARGGEIEARRVGSRIDRRSPPLNDDPSGIATSNCQPFIDYLMGRTRSVSSVCRISNKVGPSVAVRTPGMKQTMSGRRSLIGAELARASAGPCDAVANPQLDFSTSASPDRSDQPEQRQK